MEPTLFSNSSGNHCSLISPNNTEDSEAKTEDRKVDVEDKEGSVEDSKGNVDDIEGNDEDSEVKRSRGRRDSFVDLYKMTGEQLGQGSCGKVETCVKLDSGMEFAVKTIEKTAGLYTRSEITKEIGIYNICHGLPNIIQLIEYFEEDDKFQLIFEKISGGPLLQHIEAGKRLSESDTRDIINNLAESLKFLHSQGIAHRDIKPENVLCVNTGSASSVKLCDFDLCSKAHCKTDTPRMHTPVGSYDYMSPEVVKTFMVGSHGKNYNKKCDLWSLGVLMYVLLCGYPPFTGCCGSNCGWDLGEMCNSCEALLFFSIKEGRFEFCEKDWASISKEAMDLIKALLVIDVSNRFDAQDVLNHPWIVERKYSVIASLARPNIKSIQGL